MTEGLSQDQDQVTIRRAPIRVVVVDDHPIFREGIVFTLDRTDDIVVVGEAGDGFEALAILNRTRPDVVLMDLAMPGLTGLEATRRVLEIAPEAAVLVLTMSEEDKAVLASLRAGARGYLVKGVSGDEVAAAIRTVAAGHVVIGGAVASGVLGAFGAATEPALDEATDFAALTAREREILTLLAEGLTNQQIAERLVISPITARNHVSNILGKLRMSSRREVIRRFGRSDGE